MHRRATWCVSPGLLRPRSSRYDHEAPAGGATHDLAPGSGDLLVRHLVFGQENRGLMSFCRILPRRRTRHAASPQG